MPPEHYLFPIAMRAKDIIPNMFAHGPNISLVALNIWFGCLFFDSHLIICGDYTGISFDLSSSVLFFFKTNAKKGDHYHMTCQISYEYMIKLILYDVIYDIHNVLFEKSSFCLSLSFIHFSRN